MMMMMPSPAPTTSTKERSPPPSPSTTKKRQKLNGERGLKPRPQASMEGDKKELESSNSTYLQDESKSNDHVRDEDINEELFTTKKQNHKIYEVIDHWDAKKVPNAYQHALLQWFTKDSLWNILSALKIKDKFTFNMHLRNVIEINPLASFVVAENVTSVHHIHDLSLIHISEPTRPY